MMNLHNQVDIGNIILAPGEFFFGGGTTRVHTLLGSCVAITLWHPIKHIGGMCHYLLPSRGKNTTLAPGFFADDAIDFFVNSVKASETRTEEYEVKVFGGGNMFGSLGYLENVFDVSNNNISAATDLLKQHGFSSIKATDVGGTQHRKIYLELWNGDVWVQRGPSSNRRLT